MLICPMRYLTSCYNDNEMMSATILISQMYSWLLLNNYLLWLMFKFIVQLSSPENAVERNMFSACA